MRRAARVLAALGLAAGAVTPALLVAGPGAADGVFSGGATAEGTRVGLALKDFVLTSQLVNVSGPAAQAVVDGFGTSKGYAAVPYPGDVALTAHGQTGGRAPEYPLIAQSSYPTRDKDEHSSGPARMTSTSGSDFSSAEATSGGAGGDAAIGLSKSVAKVRHDPSTGVVTATADTDVQSLTFASVLRIGRVHSHVTVVAEPGKPVRRTSVTEVGQVSVAGQTVEITPAGLVLPGTTVPLPPDSTVNEILGSAGVSVHYVSGRTTEAQTISDAVSISVEQPVPGTSGGVVTYVVGTASAYAQPGGESRAAEADSGFDLAVPPGNLGGGASEPGAADFAFAADPAPAADLPLPSADAPQVAPDGGEPAAAAPDRVPLTGVAMTSSASFYAVLVLAAMALVVSTVLFRLLAVRLAWS